MKVVDLFCGCGGMTQGFSDAGCEVVAAFDNWDPALAVYRANFPGHPAVKCDLGMFADDASSYIRAPRPRHSRRRAPCQDFSSAGKRDETLGRADLTVSFARIVAAAAPSWFVMENVSRASGSVAFGRAKDILRAAGYGLTEEVLDASLCGVPQRRKRLFLVGERGGPDGGLSVQLRGGLAGKPMTVRDYLGGELGLEHYYRHPRSYRRRGVFSVDEPSPTVRGVNRPVPKGYPRHSGDPVGVEGLRPLTTLERARVQTFPPGFRFEGSKHDLDQAIGNAVPPRLAEYVARAIARY